MYIYFIYYIYYIYKGVQVFLYKLCTVLYTVFECCLMVIVVGRSNIAYKRVLILWTLNYTIFNRKCVVGRFFAH